MVRSAISHYRILEKLGEGGMGVVYKAQDTKLDRIVALKFLPQRFTASETEQARFLQEAKAAAALSHPNICPIHSIEEEDGELFIVMDNIDGQTLRQKLSAGPLSVKQTLEIGAQIADGLGAAHELGIVHRDIKPENIMIRKDGLIQIMDFGLAKLRGASRLTKEGSTVGTMGYMSPEQVQGHDVDARSDIFSLGVVIHELLTGKLPFKGEHEAAVVYQIINVEAPRTSSLRQDVSPDLDALITECMAKDPEDRYQYAREVSRQLKRLKEDSKQRRTDRKDPSRESSHSPPPSMAPPGVRTHFLWIGSAIVLIGASIFYFTQVSGRSPEINPNWTIHDLETRIPPGGYPGLSGDGNWVAFPARDANGKWDVYFMNTSARDARRITNDGSYFIQSVDVSFDGSQIAFVCFDSARGESHIKVVSSLGGQTRIISDRGSILRWCPDAHRLGYLLSPDKSPSGKIELWSVRPDGNESRLEFIDSASTIPRSLSFSWSPDGKSIAWLRGLSLNSVEIMIRDLTSGNERQLTFDSTYIDEVFWTRNNAILFSSRRRKTLNLWMIPSKGGEPVQITKGAGRETGMQISADGRRLVYFQGQMVGHVWLVPLDGTQAQQVTFDDSDIRWPALSPDGKRIAFHVGVAGGGVFIMDRDGTNQVRLTPPSWIAMSPKWSPNGRWIGFHARSSSEMSDLLRVYIVEAMNPQTPKLVADGRLGMWVDDSTLAVTGESRSRLVSINGGELGPFFEDSTLAVQILSGKYILFHDIRQGREGLWIASIDHHSDPGRKWVRQISNFEAGVPFVSRGGMFLMRWQQKELWRVLLPDGRKEKTHASFTSVGEFPSGSIGHDGTEIVYSDSHNIAKLVMIENLFK